MKKRILEIVYKKIRKFEGKIEKYREIQDVLSGACDEVISKLNSTTINLKSAFKNDTKLGLGVLKTSSLGK